MEADEGEDRMRDGRRPCRDCGGKGFVEMTTPGVTSVCQACVGLGVTGLVIVNRMGGKLSATEPDSRSRYRCYEEDEEH